MSFYVYIYIDIYIIIYKYILFMYNGYIFFLQCLSLKARWKNHNGCGVLYSTFCLIFCSGLVSDCLTCVGVCLFS